MCASNIEKCNLFYLDSRLSYGFWCISPANSISFSFTTDSIKFYSRKIPSKECTLNVASNENRDHDNNGSFKVNLFDFAMGALAIGKNCTVIVLGFGVGKLCYMIEVCRQHYKCVTIKLQSLCDFRYETI